MRKLKIKDKNKRFFVFKFEEYKKISKSIINNNTFNNLIKWNIIRKQSFLSKNSSRIRVSNRCVVSNRRNVIYKHFRLSRLIFLKFARFGILYGITK